MLLQMFCDPSMTHTCWNIATLVKNLKQQIRCSVLCEEDDGTMEISVPMWKEKARWIIIFIWSFFLLWFFFEKGTFELQTYSMMDTGFLLCRCQTTTLLFSSNTCILLCRCQTNTLLFSAKSTIVDENWLNVPGENMSSDKWQSLKLKSNPSCCLAEKNNS